MNDIKNLKKFEDDIEVLSIEDLYYEEPAPVKKKRKKRRKKKKTANFRNLPSISTIWKTALPV